MFNHIYPFAAIVVQKEMKLAPILTAINPKIGGVLIRGEKGTAKSTTLRSLAALLPSVRIHVGCPFYCDPDDGGRWCPRCGQKSSGQGVGTRRTRVVTLPLNATEDRVSGGIDFHSALKKGARILQPRLLAHAHRGILYVDEVNLLDDHIVDIILDAAASGRKVIEREGISFAHPSSFILVGTMNPEEGELRPQLLDRFGLCVNIEGIHDPEERVPIMKRRAAFDEDPEAFCRRWEVRSNNVVEKIQKAMECYPRVQVDRSLLYEIASYCLDVGVDGHRTDIIMFKSAKTLTAYNGRTQVLEEDVHTAAELVLPHRIRRQPLQDIVVDVAQLRRKKTGDEGGGCVMDCSSGSTESYLGWNEMSPFSRAAPNLTAAYTNPCMMLSVTEACMAIESLAVLGIGTVERDAVNSSRGIWTFPPRGGK